MKKQNESYIVSVYTGDGDFDNRQKIYRFDDREPSYILGFMAAMQEVYGRDRVECNIVE